MLFLAMRVAEFVVTTCDSPTAALVPWIEHDSTQRRPSALGETHHANKA